MTSKLVIAILVGCATVSRADCPRDVVYFDYMPLFGLDVAGPYRAEIDQRVAIGEARQRCADDGVVARQVRIGVVAEGTSHLTPGPGMDYSDNTGAPALGLEAEVGWSLFGSSVRVGPRAAFGFGGDGPREAVGVHVHYHFLEAGLDVIDVAPSKLSFEPTGHTAVAAGLGLSLQPRASVGSVIGAIAVGLLMSFVVVAAGGLEGS